MQCNYLEGCTAPQFSSNQLHAAVVELVALKMRQLNIQQFKIGTPGMKMGLVVFIISLQSVALCGKNARISWTQVETGSAITWKYPSCISIG